MWTESVLINVGASYGSTPRQVLAVNQIARFRSIERESHLPSIRPPMKSARTFAHMLIATFQIELTERTTADDLEVFYPYPVADEWQ